MILMKLKITVTGKVHDVGYRLHLLNHADSLLIDHFDARNVIANGKEALIVLVEGNEEQIREFVDFVKSSKPDKAIVEDIRIEEFTGTIRTVDSYRNSLMLEQLNKIVQVGLNMLEKQDKTIEKIDETKSYLGEKIDNVSEKIDLLRSDLKSYMDSRFDRIEREIERIKAKIGLD